MKITLKMQVGAVPAVMSLLDGHAKPGKAQIVCYPAIRFPGVKNEIALIEKGQTDPKPAKSYVAAEKIAARIVKEVVAKARAAMAEQKKPKVKKS